MMKQRYVFRDMNVFMPYVLIHVAEDLFEGIVRFNDEEDRTILLVFRGEDDYDETLKHFGNQYDVINMIGIEHDAEIYTSDDGTRHHSGKSLIDLRLGKCDDNEWIITMTAKNSSIEHCIRIYNGEFKITSCVADNNDIPKKELIDLIKNDELSRFIIETIRSTMAKLGAKHPMLFWNDEDNE